MHPPSCRAARPVSAACAVKTSLRECAAFPISAVAPQVGMQKDMRVNVNDPVMRTWDATSGTTGSVVGVGVAVGSASHTDGLASGQLSSLQASLVVAARALLLENAARTPA